MAGESIGVDRGRGDHEVQVVAAIEEPPEISEEEVDVQAPLVRLIDDDRVVATQFGVALELGQQDAVGHEADAGCVGYAIVETDAEPDLSAEFHTELGRHPRGDGAGRHPTWLGVADHSVRATTRRQTELRQLGALPRAGLPRNHHDPVVAERRDQIVGVSRDRQVVGNRDPEFGGGRHGHRRR